MSPPIRSRAPHGTPSCRPLHAMIGPGKHLWPLRASRSSPWGPLLRDCPEAKDECPAGCHSCVQHQPRRTPPSVRMNSFRRSRSPPATARAPPGEQKSFLHVDQRRSACRFVGHVILRCQPPGTLAYLVALRHHLALRGGSPGRADRSRQDDHDARRDDSAGAPPRAFRPGRHLAEPKVADHHRPEHRHIGEGRQHPPHRRSDRRRSGRSARPRPTAPQPHHQTHSIPRGQTQPKGRVSSDTRTAPSSRSRTRSLPSVPAPTSTSRRSAPAPRARRPQRQNRAQRLRRPEPGRDRGRVMIRFTPTSTHHHRPQPDQPEPLAQHQRRQHHDDHRGDEAQGGDLRQRAGTSARQIRVPWPPPPRCPRNMCPR